MADHPDTASPARATKAAADTAMIFGWLDDADERAGKLLDSARELEGVANRALKMSAEIRERLSRTGEES